MVSCLLPQLCLAGSYEFQKTHPDITSTNSCLPLLMCFHTLRLHFHLSGSGSFIVHRCEDEHALPYGKDRPKDLSLTPSGHVSFRHHWVLDLCLVESQNNMSEECSVRRCPSFQPTFLSSFLSFFFFPSFHPFFVPFWLRGQKDWVQTQAPSLISCVTLEKAS